MSSSGKRRNLIVWSPSASHSVGLQTA